MALLVFFVYFEYFLNMVISGMYVLLWNSEDNSVISLSFLDIPLKQSFP